MKNRISSTSEFDKIQRECYKLKVYWQKTYPMCIFCLQSARPGTCQLCHKIRRSDISRRFSIFTLQTMKENTGLGHPTCHDTWDNDIKMRKYLPGYKMIMQDIFKIDPDIYYKLTILY